MLKGSFDRYAVTGRKRGTATIDNEFLKEIETWREALAKQPTPAQIAEAQRFAKEWKPKGK